MADFRALVHRSISWAAAVTFALASGAVTFGGEDARLKIAEGADALYTDTRARTAIALIALALILIWFFTKPDVWNWLRCLRRQPPSLYLSNIVHYPDLRGKMIGISWHPTELDLEVRGDLPYHTWPPEEPKETGLNFNALNVEADDLRHLQATWEIPGFNLVQSIKGDNFFGEALASITADRLSLSIPTRAASRPVATKCKGGPIPLVKSGETVVIRAPEPFTNAFAIFLLLKARRLAKRNAFSGPLNSTNILETLEANRTLFDGVTLRLTFMRRERRCRQDFTIRGFLWGAQEQISHNPGEDGKFSAVAGGISTVLDYLEASPADW